MADEVQIKVDATRALAKFDRIPVTVRDSLRRVIPDLTKQLGRLVNAKLDSELKSRTHLNVAQEMHESTNYIYGVVRVDWTGAAAQKLVPRVLESGAKAHEIAARNASALAFFWEKIGKNVMFRRVMHPGFAGLFFMQRSFDEMKPQIVSEIKSAAKAGAGKA